MCLTMLPGVAFAEENTATTTDEYGFDLSTPSGFNANDGVHPLGQGSKIKGNLNPTGNQRYGIARRQLQQPCLRLR